MTDFQVISRVGETLPSPARMEEPSGRPVLRIAAVQCAWNPDPEEHRETLAKGIRVAAERGATVDLPSGADALALLRDHARRSGDRERRSRGRRDRSDGRVRPRDGGRGRSGRPRIALRARSDGQGFNTAIGVEPGGRLLARTRKVHIPAFPYYHEDHYFAPGDTGFPVVEVGERASASRPAGTSGSPSWPGSTRSRGRRSSSTRRRSAQSRTSTTSTLSRCGGR